MAKQTKKQIDIEGDKYEFVFTDRRIDIIESTIGTSIFGDFYQNNMMVPMSHLKTMFIQGLKKVDGPYISTEGKKAEEAFTSVRNSIGYSGLITLVIEALQEDCGFFFLEG